jgi:Bacterial protein of unknown function (DUF937)
MFSLQDLLGQQGGDEALGQISQNIGAEPSLTSSAISMALPMLINAMGNQAQSGNAGALTEAITQDDGGLLSNLGGLGSLLGGGGQSSAASGILGMLLGGNQGNAANQISQQSGLGVGQVANLLMMLASQGLNSGGILDMLTGHQQQVQQAPQADQGILGSLLDSDHDGSAMDDIASMALKYMTNR